MNRNVPITDNNQTANPKESSPINSQTHLNDTGAVNKISLGQLQTGHNFHRQVYAKGAQDLISALKDIDSDFKLLIVGDGPYKEELERIASQHQSLENKIEFLGYKTGTEIPEILKQTDIFVNPSYSEGLPTSVMEACAAGCATIATDVGGTNEIILTISPDYYTHHNCQELREKLNYLIENPILRNKYGAKAQSYVQEQFSWDEITGRWVDLIEHV